MNYKKDLLETILPFWLKTIDQENGGILTQVDEAGKIYGREKSVWFQGRRSGPFPRPII